MFTALGQHSANCQEKGSLEWSSQGCERRLLSIRSNQDSKALHNLLSKEQSDSAPGPTHPFLPMKSALLPSPSQKDLLTFASSLEKTGGDSLCHGRRASPGLPARPRTPYPDSLLQVGEPWAPDHGAGQPHPSAPHWLTASATQTCWAPAPQSRPWPRAAGCGWVQGQGWAAPLARTCPTTLAPAGAGPLPPRQLPLWQPRPKAS